MKKNTLIAYVENPDPAGEPLELRVDAMLADQMRAELEVKKRGQSPETAGINFVAAMAWCALARTGQIEDKLEAFALRCYDVSRLDPDEAGDVDPTRPTASTDSV